MRKYRETKEQKVARLILEKLSDLTLDLEMVAYYISGNVRSVLYNRFQVVAETAMEEKEKQIGR